jgi:hypothetical protein
MKVVAFFGSPRIHGNTELLLEEALRPAREAGHEVIPFKLNYMNIKPCQNCGGCEKTGVCIVNDAMRAYLTEAGGVVPNVLDTKKLVFTGSVNLSKSDILGLHEELGQFQLENSGTLTLDKDIDKEAFHRIERIHNTGKLRVPSEVHHLALLKVGHVHGEVEKY